MVFSIPLISVQTKLKRMATKIFLMDMIIYIYIIEKQFSWYTHKKRRKINWFLRSTWTREGHCRRSYGNYYGGWFQYWTPGLSYQKPAIDVIMESIISVKLHNDVYLNSRITLMKKLRKLLCRLISVLGLRSILPNTCSER